jgi:glyoxylase-like metal-dependent hydrolase (beta-lactamase superfamily II)
MCVRRLAFGSTMAAVVLLCSCPSAFAMSDRELAIKVFTSPDDQFSVNSVIVEGSHEVMLVDAQLTKASAEKVLQEIKDTKKPLSIIYITHEHADHFLGLEVLKEAYPGVRIIATSAVVERINKVYRDKIDKWQRVFGAGASSKAIPTKTPCFGFRDSESSSPAMCCSMTRIYTPARLTAPPERNGGTR